VRTIEFEPLQYGFWEHGDRLAMRIDNPTTNLVTIQEGRSYVVGPEGRSHTLPLKNAPIAPGGHVVMVLPPQVPVATPAAYVGPSFGLGFGFGRGYWHRHRYYGYDPFFYPSFGYYAPMYYQPAWYVDDVPLWQWKQGTVSLRLAYQSENGSAFTHDFVFDRRKVED
jgi:hypothetical protein